MIRFGGKSCWLVWLLLALSADLQARNELNLNAGVAVFADDNYGLRAAQEEKAEGSRQRANLGYVNSSETTNIEAGVSWFDTYLVDSDFKEDDYYDIYGAFKHSWLTTVLDAELRARSDTTVTDELLIDGPQTVDVGRDRYTLDLQLNHNFNETFRLSGGISAEQVSFDKSNPDLLEYDYYSANLQPFWFYQSNAAFYLSVFANQVEYQEKPFEEVGFLRPIPTKTETNGANIGWRYQPTETLLSNISVGYRESEYNTTFFNPIFFGPIVVGLEEIEFDENGSGAVVNGELTYTGERSRTSLYLSQQAAPNSAGNVIDTKRIALNYRYNLTERAFFTTGVTYTEQRSELEDQQDDDLDTIRVIAKLLWKFRRNLHLYAGHRYLERQLVNLDQDGESNRIELGLNWIMDPLTW